MSQTHNPLWGSWDVGPTPIETYTSNLQGLIKSGLLKVDSASMEEHFYYVNTGNFRVEVTDTSTEITRTTTENFGMTIKAEDVGSDENQKITVILTRFSTQKTYEFTYSDIHDVERQFLSHFAKEGVLLPLTDSPLKMKFLDWGSRGRIEPQMGLVHLFSLVLPFQAYMESGDSFHVDFL